MTDTPSETTVIDGTGTVTIPPAHEPVANDTTNVRIVILGLIVIALAIIICTTVLTMAGWVVPDWMGTVAAGVIGGLAALLASTSSRRT